MANPKGTIYKKRHRIHLHEHEVARVIEMSKRTRFPIRNELLVVLSYSHALRASEACDLKWTDVDLTNRTIKISRKKGGKSGIHPIELDREYELLHQHYKNRDPKCPYIFMTQYRYERDRFTPLNFNDLCLRLGEMAEFDFKLTPHMLRHAMTTFLHQKKVDIFIVRDYVGHTRISSTEKYIHLVASRFDGITKGSIFA